MAIHKYSGTVISTFSKALDAPDKFENTHKHALKVNLNGEETFINFGANKMDAFLVEEDGKWQIVGPGSEVVFKYTDREYNGKTYYDAKKSDLLVMSLVVGEKYKAPEQAAKPVTGNTNGGPAQKVDWDANQKRITFGMCFNNACNQLGSSYNPEVLRERVVELYALAQEGSLLATKDNLASWGSAKEEAPVATAKPKPSTAAKKPVVVEEEIEDDKSPF